MAQQARAPLPALRVDQLGREPSSAASLQSLPDLAHAYAWARACRVASLEAQRSPIDAAAAARRPGLEAALCTLTALSHSPQDAAAGLATASAALAELAAGGGGGAAAAAPETATAAAAAGAALAARGVDPSDALHQKGVEAAAQALMALAACHSGDGQAGSLAAAVQALQAAGVDLRGCAVLEPGMAAAVAALEAMAANPRAPATHRPGFQRGAAALAALCISEQGGAGE